MSLLSQIKASLASANIEPNDVEIKGSAPRESRNIYKAMVFGIVITASLGAQVSLADEVKNTLHASETIESIEIPGNNIDRNTAKALGQGLAARLIKANTGQWPAQKNKEFYSPDELAEQYDAANKAVLILKNGVKDIVNTDNITFYPSYKALKEHGGDVAGAAAGIANAGEQPYSLRPETFLSRIGLFHGQLADECAIIVPHINDPTSNIFLKDLIYKPITTKDPQSKTDAFKFTLYHEAGHCFSSMMQNEELSLLNQTNKGIAAFTGSRETTIPNSAVLFDTSNETVADSFGLLKMQQEYYILNKEKITAHQLPQIMPLLESVRDVRHKLAGSDSTHDTSPAIQEIIDQLKKPGQLEKLALASNSDLLMTAYGVLDKTYASVKHNADIPDAYSVSFPKDYQDASAHSIFSANQAEENTFAPR